MPTAGSNFKSLLVCLSPCIEAEDYINGVLSNGGEMLVGGVIQEMDLMRSKTAF